VRRSRVLAPLYDPGRTPGSSRGGTTATSPAATVQPETVTSGRERADDVLELQGLTRRYGDVVALDDLSFAVAEGQMFGFVGPNGAGKTTAMRIVLGVLEPDAGRVFWRGSPIDEQTRRRTGYMPEDHGQTFSTQCARIPGHSGASSVSSASR
jgi:ABC-type glutathione transport system ATPase component